MAAFALHSALVWTFKGLMCTWRFFWISPYYVLKSSGWRQKTDDKCSRPDTDKTELLRKPEALLHNSILLERLLKAEEEIEKLKIEVSRERSSWEKRFMELQRRRHAVRDQMTSEILVRPATQCKEETNWDSGGTDEAFGESVLENVMDPEQNDKECLSTSESYLLRDSVHQQYNSVHQQYNSVHQQYNSVHPYESRATSAVSNMSAPWCRVFVPHSPLDLRTGHRVRVLLPSGRVSTGTLRFLGHARHSPDFLLGVELETADDDGHGGASEGRGYFDCKPGHGALVSFSKLLMVWE